MKFTNKLFKIISKKNVVMLFEACVILILGIGAIVIIHDGLRSLTRSKEGIENNDILDALNRIPTLPPGPRGPGESKEDDDKYMLKSEMVPPVCPKCPDSATCPKQEECPPCPACERCPEPSFTCKKVPNYQSDALKNDHSLPLGYLNSFEQF